MAQSSQLTALYAPINWVAEENIIFGPLATPFVDSWVQRVLDENYWDCSEAFTKLIARFRLLVRYAESSGNGPSNLARDKFMLEGLKRTLGYTYQPTQKPSKNLRAGQIKTPTFGTGRNIGTTLSFSHWHREEFIKECQGIEYWCKNGNWLQPPSARPKVGEPELPTPQEYGHVQRPYGRIGIGIGSGKNSSSIPLLVPPFRRHELPAMEPPAEARGPPSRFDTRLLPLGPNTYLS
ncbi:hypothetical protein B0T13DRAFT_405916 [Neurospora crassa]|nr:hypothetical protein B0T13DRAFT_405916 [Neurospora crassa]